ncbi:MAG TPA: hypothetical protein VN253_07085 [Kofleriaceae bacterium]|nr:hypothetical protein [Kofleriaceae bacterium]
MSSFTELDGRVVVVTGASSPVIAFAVALPARVNLPAIAFLPTRQTA